MSVKPRARFYEEKEQNKRVQGMSHKVRHPLTRDVQQMRSDPQNLNTLSEV